MDIFYSGDAFVLVRTAVIAVFAYVGLVVLLRISGRRSLSKMNAFDLVVTVALGSTLATILLSKDVTLAQGLLAMGLLIGMQYLVTWASVRAGWVRRLVTGEPALLYYNGTYLQQAMKQARVTQDEVRAAVRGAGQSDMHAVQAVVLETDGSFSVVSDAPEAQASHENSLEGVNRPGDKQPPV